MFFSPQFKTVALSARELKYWVPGVTLSAPHSPTLVSISSEWEQHTILIKRPTGLLTLASRKPNWEVSLSKALADVLVYPGISGDEAAVLWWRQFIGTRGQEGSAASGLFIMPSRSFFDKEASIYNLGRYRAHDSFLDATTATRVVQETGTAAPYRRTVNSSQQQAQRAGRS
jgi:hypothetical protein